MVRKDEPLKVTDLEGGDEVSPSNYGKGNKEPVKRSVFNRLAYGAGSRASKSVKVGQNPDSVQFFFFLEMTFTCCFGGKCQLQGEE